MRIITVFISLILLINCKKSDDLEAPGKFDQTIMLDNIYQTAIKPFNYEFKKNSLVLDSLITEFPTNPTQTKLTEIREAWISTTSSWKKSELYHFDFIIVKNLHNQIDKWPINQPFIDSRLADSSFYTELIIDGIGSTSKGLHALEYILFKDSATRVIEILTSPTSYSYVSSIAKNIVKNSNEIYNTWETSKTDFTSNTSPNLLGSLNQLINNQIGILEYIIGAKLGKPMGKSSGLTVDLDKLESFYSETSLDHIRDNIFSLKQSYFAGNSSGIDDLLVYKNSLCNNNNLNQEVTAKINKCTALLNSTDKTLKWLLINNRDYTESLYKCMKELLIIFKIDISSNLGILVTFNDNDGD